LIRVRWRHPRNEEITQLIEQECLLPVRRPTRACAVNWGYGAATLTNVNLGECKNVDCVSKECIQLFLDLDLGAKVQEWHG